MFAKLEWVEQSIRYHRLIIAIVPSMNLICLFSHMSSTQFSLFVSCPVVDSTHNDEARKEYAKVEEIDGQAEWSTTSSASIDMVRGEQPSNGLARRLDANQLDMVLDDQCSSNR
jgi:hypothetical protein